MPSTDPQVHSIACPACGAQYDFPASMAGRQGRCVSCGNVFAVPAFEASVRVDTSKIASIFEEDQQVSTPQYIAVECRVCQTRMYGRPDQVGQTIKCPDCGARTEVPPPPKPKPKNIPAALEGDQYELWDSAEQPLPSALVAAQPKYIAIKCRQCDTLMYAMEKQVGETIACPDCGKKHKVPSPRQPKPVQPVLTSAAETPILDSSFAPVERPPALPATTLQKIEDELDATPHAKALEESRRTGKPLKVDRRGRPILPRWPLITGIIPFFFSSGVSERWLALTMGYMFGGYLISEGLIWGSAGGLAAMSALMFFVTGMLICMLLTAAGSGMFRAVVTESSEGNDQIQDWGTRYINEWFPDLLNFVMAAFVSAFPGTAIARLVTDDLGIQIVAADSGAVALFPIVYLSQLYSGSPWAVLSGKIAASLGRYPGTWLLFYLESGALWGLCVCAGVAAVVMRVHPVLPIPLYVAAFLLYGRLLGRIGWRLADAT